MSPVIAWFEAHIQPYWLRHAVIAVLIMLACWPVFGPTWAALIASGFYLGHELDDLYRLHKNGNRFDWPGLLAPWAAVLAIWLIFA